MAISNFFPLFSEKPRWGNIFPTNKKVAYLLIKIIAHDGDFEMSSLYVFIGNILF
jgi:hypothetical protein